MPPRRSDLYPALSSGGRARAERAPGIARFFKTEVPLFRRVPAPILERLAEEATERRYPEGSYVCRTGDAATEIWVVREGRLSVNQCGWTGNRLSIEVMIRGDVSGLAAVSCRTYPGEVIATRATVLLAVPRSVVVDAIEKYPVLAREILYAYGQRLNYIETLLYLSRERVEQRLVAALLYLYHKFGFVLPLNRAEVSEMAGTTPETAIRVLRRLTRQGVLEGRRGRVRILDLQRLKSLLKLPPAKR